MESPRYSSFTYKWECQYQPPIVVFASEVTIITSQVFKYRPRRFLGTKTPLFEAMDLLRDVRRLLCEDHSVITRATKDALDLADQFIASWFADKRLSVQLGNTFTNMDAHVRAFYMVFLSRHTLDGSRVSYYALDAFAVQVNDVLGSYVLPWGEVPKFCAQLHAGQNTHVSNKASPEFGHSGALLGSDVEVKAQHNQAGSLGYFGNVADLLLDPDFITH